MTTGLRGTGIVDEIRASMVFDAIAAQVRDAEEIAARNERERIAREARELAEELERERSERRESERRWWDAMWQLAAGTATVKVNGDWIAIQYHDEGGDDE
jgi:hypothetical protein